LEEYTGEKLLVIDAPIYRFYFRPKAVRLFPYNLGEQAVICGAI
jgi:hypothetical protein